MNATAEQVSTSEKWDLINDLCALPDSEEFIIDYLLRRLRCGKIYTWVGPLLLVLNPCNEISTKDIYSSSLFNKFYDVSNIPHKEAAPHIFTIATKAHHNLTQEFGRNCQVIVISGETGSGKTFNASKCLEFLSAVKENTILPSQGDHAHNIVLRIKDACHLISAFTTACTERNKVSSRHGQLVRLHYKGGAISGATINSLLLERNRVTNETNNFQIFYQIMLGLSNEELEKLNLSRDEHYHIVNTIDYNKLKYYQKEFQITLEALEILGFDVDEKNQIFRILALIIHMGNIQFVVNGESCRIDLVNQKSKEALKNACSLSSLNEEDIVELLTTILINPQSTWRKYTQYHRRLVTVDACRSRLNSILRHLYDLLFHWILNRTNEALSVKYDCADWLGILDIFGFESFNRNGIEQLCVNYANEKMQLYFMEMYLEKNRKDLEEEGFLQSKGSLNIICLYQERLSVIEEALFSTLNDACLLPVNTPTPTIIQLVHKKSRKTRRRFLTEKQGNFIIEHYSGPVSYSIADVLSKNIDKVPSELSTIFRLSNDGFLRSLINNKEANSMIPSSIQKGTMLAKFKYSINALIKELSQCDLHYVRCVKPRSHNGEWDKRDLQKQLAYTGTFDAMPLGKCKYPIRLNYEDFCTRYSKRHAESSDMEKCKMILEYSTTRKELNEQVHYGKRLVCLTEFVFFKLETCRRNYRKNCISKIESFWIKHRRNKISHISKYCTNKCRLGDKLAEKNKQIDNLTEFSWIDDDVFLRSPRDGNSSESQNYVTTICGDTKGFIPKVEFDERTTPKNKNNSSKRKSRFLYCGLGGWRKKCTGCKDELKDILISRFLKNITRAAMEHEHPLMSTSPETSSNNISDVEIGNNNLVTNRYPYTYLNNSSMNEELGQRNDKILYYNQVRSQYTIRSDYCTLFYKNRILSRRQLASVPIRVHTRRTPLFNSHVIPRSELPQGLPDLRDCL